MYDSWNYLNNTQHYQNTPLVSIQDMSTVAYSLLKICHIFMYIMISLSLTLYSDFSYIIHKMISDSLFKKKKKILLYYIQHELSLALCIQTSPILYTT